MKFAERVPAVDVVGHKARLLVLVCLGGLWGALVLALPAGARAEAQPTESAGADDLATRWKVNDADPKSSIPSEAERNSDPVEFGYFLQDLLARGQRAIKDKNWHDAVKYFEAIGVAVPDSRLPFDRLCTAYANLGQYAHAAGSCGRAVALPGAKVTDHLRFVENSLQSETFGPADRENVEASLRHLRAHLAQSPGDDQADEARDGGVAADAGPPRKKTPEELLAGIRALAERPRGPQAGRPPEAQAKKSEPPPKPIHLPTQVAFLDCKLALKVGDHGRLETCIGELRALKVDTRQVLALSWSHALVTRDERKADELFKQMRSLGAPESTLAVMEREQAKAFPSRVGVRLWGPLAASLALVMVGAFVMRSRRRRVASLG